MTTISETGHAKNVANFEVLISFCNGYGVVYNPSKNSIKIVALNTLKTTAQGNIATVTNTNTAFNNATNSRQIVFAPIKKLATKIVNALAATDAAQQTIDDAKTINRKIQGSRKEPITPPPPPTDPNATPPEDNSISVSQQSYDSLLDNFKKLIALVTAEPTYLPNENELKVVNLNIQAADLATKNTAVIGATTTLSNARIARNKTLYTPKTGLYDTTQEVKKYVKSVFGATSPEYKQVSGIKFVNLGL